MLIGLLLPAVQAAREAARRNTCANDAAQLGLAMLNFESGHKSFPGYANTIGSNSMPVSWVIALLPYMEHSDVYNLFAGTNGMPVTTQGLPSLKLLTCPTDPPTQTIGDQSLAYVCNRGINGFDSPCLGVCMNQATPTVASNITGFTPVKVGIDYISSHDGSSMTFLLSELPLSSPANPNAPHLVNSRVPASAAVPTAKWIESAASLLVTADSTTNTGVFGNPGGTSNSNFTNNPSGHPGGNDLELEVGFEWGTFSGTPTMGDKVLSAHSGGANMCFCDGHQSFVNSNLDLYTFKALMTPWGDGILLRTSTARDATLSATYPWNQTSPALSKATPPTVPLPEVGFIVDEGNL